MTDNTPGTRDEKHTATDFANAVLARHEDGRIAHRNAAHDTDWQAVAEEQEGTVGALIAELERHRAMAKLWKETTREHIGRARTALSYADAAQLARAVASVTPCSCSAQRARAEKAVQERDEARAMAALWKETSRELFKARERWRGVARLAEYERDHAYQRNGYNVQRAEKAERERDEARAAMSELAPAEVCVRGFWFKPSELPEVLGRVMDSRDEAQREAKRYYIRSTDPRPHTPEVTDAMVKRARVAWAGANVNLTRDGFVREVLTAALTEPRRPEGAETLAFDLDEAHKGGGDVQDEADRLYAMGYRKVES